MKKPALVISLALGMAVVASPALAEKYVVENNTARDIYVRCGAYYQLTPGSETGILTCPYGFRLSRTRDGETITWTGYLCEGREQTVHRLEIVDTAPFEDTPSPGLNMWFISSCEFE